MDVLAAESRSKQVHISAEVSAEDKSTYPNYLLPYRALLSRRLQTTSCSRAHFIHLPHSSGLIAHHGSSPTPFKLECTQCS